MSIDRRQFIGGAAAAALGAGAAVGAENGRGGKVGKSKSVNAKGAGLMSGRGNPIAISTYSFWRFKEGLKLPIEQCIEEAAEMGFDGVEILHMQMESEKTSYLNKLKKTALVNGVDLCGMSTHQGFVSPDEEKRQRNIDHTIKCIELAYELGIPCIRINTGTWGTSESFDELMENRGIEEPLEGYTDEDAFPWVIGSIEECLKVAEKRGVVLGLENHWGLGRTPEGVLRIVNAIDSEYLGVLTDTGNFLEDPYDKIVKMAPQTVFMQAKTYFGGGLWYTLDLDYDRIAKIMKESGYKGYISLEFEGQADYKEAIPKSLELLRGAFS
ncbi:Hydroxypyruvate isomerase [Anaerohalosphaera lusitana]|uniref:Hydroxypyruvate isomerase n=1 Tax=Anaerohalosphaera lusitana TaxID=1936003 RepID=A0A1U9NJZ9_9BACT|nr:sugar phosphate isomerase/epimerase family protein [Anaerohalosphaera lusitana]AQT68137.1 Hydroxypyruvate isomerase [Anaerohalosphaera lusitana]